MKRWLLIVIPALVLGGLMFVKPPAFTTGKTPINPGTSQSTAKPGIPGGGGDEQPSYGGHEADEYGTPKKK